MKWIKLYILMGLLLFFTSISALYADQQAQQDQNQFLKPGVYFTGAQFFELKSNGTVIHDNGSVGTYKVQDGKLVNTYKGINESFIAGISQKKKYQYNTTYNIKTDTLIRDNYYSYKLWKEGSTREDFATQNGLWLAVRPNSSAYGFALDENKKLYLSGNFLFKFNSAEGMYISPLSPSKRYRTAVSWDFDKGGIQLLIVEMQTGRIAASDGINGGGGRGIPSFAHWLSWSPDERYALISPGGEGVRELMQIDLKTKIAKNVPLKRFAEEYQKGIKEMQITKIESVKWIDNQKYSVKISLYCNPYDDNKCSGNSTPRRTFEASINIATEKIDYKQTR
jgi:hypothetical protein